MEAALKVPQTALEVYDMMPERTRCEVIENVLYMSPAPTERHEWIRMEIAHAIFAYVKKNKLGKVYSPTPDVYFLDQQSAFVPDIAVILKENYHLIKNGKIYGAPDIIVEVLSPDNKRDTVAKKNIYEQGGVKEYFVIDPTTRDTTCWLLLNGAFEEQYTEKVGFFKSTVLNIEFEFDYE